MPCHWHVTLIKRRADKWWNYSLIIVRYTLTATVRCKYVAVSCGYAVYYTNFHIKFEIFFQKLCQDFEVTDVSCIFYILKQTDNASREIERSDGLLIDNLKLRWYYNLCHLRDFLLCYDKRKRSQLI